MGQIKKKVWSQGFPWCCNPTFFMLSFILCTVCNLQTSDNERSLFKLLNMNKNKINKYDNCSILIWKKENHFLWYMKEYYWNLKSTKVLQSFLELIHSWKCPLKQAPLLRSLTWRCYLFCLFVNFPWHVTSLVQSWCAKGLGRVQTRLENYQVGVEFEPTQSSRVRENRLAALKGRKFEFLKRTANSRKNS